MRGANIFLAYKGGCTLQQLMNIRVRRFETGLLHELFTALAAFSRGLGRDISWRKLETQANISDLANRRSFHLIKDRRGCWRRSSALFTH